MAVEIKLNGFDVLANRLREIAPALRKRVIQNSLNAGARLIRDKARSNFTTAFRKNTSKLPYRLSGTVKKAIRARISKVSKRDGDLGAFVNVLPLKRTKAAYNGRTKIDPKDPFYWRWLEFGWNPNGGKNRSSRQKRSHRLLKGSRIPGAKFLTRASSEFPRALKVFQTQVGAWLDKVNQTGQVQP
jgi:hypothetical protein